MPLFSLPSNGGIGDIGADCFEFIDSLHELGANYWQILPLNLVDKGGCPYASPAAFGAEPLLIDASSLGIQYFQEFQHEIDYETLRERKLTLLNDFVREKRQDPQAKAAIESFCEKYTWARDLAVFLSLREAYGESWSDWPRELWDLDVARQKVSDHYADSLHNNLLLQVLFHEQWKKVREYCELKKIKIIGDIPIFVSADSFDAWRWPELFKIHPNTMKPLVVTGAPPDEFNEEGQLWGTVNYHWDSPKLTKWWLDRLKYCQDLYHLTRIDHFVGLHHVWESSPQASDARLGEYIPSKGRMLLKAIAHEFPDLPFIAEDLGVINDDIRSLRDEFHYPTMRVYQFSLEEKGKPLTAPSVNEHMPKNVPEHAFYYSGTHDNDTLYGWIEEVFNDPERSQQLKERFAEESKPALVHRKIIKDILQSQARDVIFPLQDLFFLSSQARINVPGTSEGNWSWRFSKAQWDHELWMAWKEEFKATQRGHHV